MTREELIDAIWDNEDTWSCPKYNCDEPEEEGNTGECCKKCAENLLVQYEKQIRAEVIDECNRKLDELERDYKSCYGVEIIEMYAEVYEDFRTWLKEQNK